jgi:hypothetical protein
MAEIAMKKAGEETLQLINAFSCAMMLKNTTEKLKIYFSDLSTLLKNVIVYFNDFV